MNQQIFQTNEEWLLEQGALRILRKMLRIQLGVRFQQVPPEILQRIEVEENLERLTDCVKQVLQINSPQQLSL